MNPAKRRRLDATASTLSKPFRSPLKVIPNNQAAVPNAKNDRTDNKATSPCEVKRTTASTTHPSPSNDLEQEQDVTELQKEYAALSQQLRKLRQDLDIVEQAHRIQSNNQEKKLNEAILKWRSIARDAADEVFESASTRVKDMGGLQAWQKNSMSTASQDRSSDWFDNKEEHPSSDAVDGSEETTTSSHALEDSAAVNDEESQEEREQVWKLHNCVLCLAADKTTAVVHDGRNASTAQYRSRSISL